MQLRRGRQGMPPLTEEKLADLGREWLRVVDLVRKEGIAEEHEHVRFRDADLSTKGGALLGFSALMLAADLVFLSADTNSFIGYHRLCGLVGFAALIVLTAGAFCALLSIMISRRGQYMTGWSSFGLMSLYHDRRRAWLRASAWTTAAGTVVYMAAMLVQVFVRHVS
jgi:hypothetical protein